MTILIMIICIHKKGTEQIMADNKQQSPNLRMPVESCRYCNINLSIQMPRLSLSVSVMREGVKHFYSLYTVNSIALSVPPEGR